MLSIRVLLAVASWALAQSDAQLVRIGTAAAVKGKVLALAPKAPAAAGRVLESGKPVYANDKVSTDSQSRAQLLLLDETTFTIGPNSEMVLDDFVYDPKTGEGRVQANVAKGAFRFVTGKIARQKPSNMKVKLPVGTLGIRGTIAAGQVDGDSSFVVLLGPGSGNNAGERPGEVSVSNAGSEVVLTEPGFGTRVEEGKPPSDPFLVPAAELEALTGQLGSSPESTPAGPKTGSGADEGDEEGGEESAAEESGQSTAEGGELAETFSEELEESEETEEGAQQAFQQDEQGGGIEDGLAFWQQVATRVDGEHHYYGSGAFELDVCNGGTCADDQTGSMSLQMNIDFNAQTYGGSGSVISVFDQDANASTGSVSDSATIPLTSYAAEEGPAIITLSGSNTAFDVILLNAGGEVAAEALGAASFDNGVDAGSGAVLAPIFEGLIPQ